MTHMLEWQQTEVTLTHISAQLSDETKDDSECKMIVNAMNANRYIFVVDLTHIKDTHIHTYTHKLFVVHVSQYVLLYYYFFTCTQTHTHTQSKNWEYCPSTCIRVLWLCSSVQSCFDKAENDYGCKTVEFVAAQLSCRCFVCVHEEKIILSVWRQIDRQAGR